MADNGNRGPNDSFRRSGRRRREPPIIDAAATEVPPDQTGADTVPGSTTDDLGAESEPTTAAGAAEAGSESRLATEGRSEALPADVAADDEHVAMASHTSDEPVLFGSAVRDPLRRSETDGQASSAPEETQPVGPEVASSSETPPLTEPAASTTANASPFTGNGGEPRAPSSPSASLAPPPSGSNALAGVLGLAAVILLGIIGWLVYSGGQRGGDLEATVANLKAQVATLSARPDPAPLQGQIAALDKRIAAADADRAALGKQVAAVAARIDSAGQPAPGAGGSGAKPADAAPGQESPSQSSAAPASAAPALATAAMVADLAAKVDGIDGRVTALAADQTGTAKAVASLPKPVAPDFGPVDAKLATLDTRLSAVDAKINGSDARLNGFDAKINGIDAKVNDFGSTMNAMTARMNGLEAKADDVATQTAKLRSEISNLPKVDLGPLQAAGAAIDGRVAKLEGELAAPKDGARVTEARAVGSADEAKATPIALVGQAIQQAIAAGKPYGSEIDALKTLGADPALVARLAPAATNGAPGIDALTTQWNAVRGSVLATEKPIAPAAGSTLNRFLASATSIVQVRNVGAAPGDDANALVGQIDAALAQGNVADALAAWDKLPENAKAASQAWADAAKSRVEAMAAAGDLVRGAIATLGRSPS